MYPHEPGPVLPGLHWKKSSALKHSCEGHPASPNSHPMDIWVEESIETQTAHKWPVLLNWNLTSECGMSFPEGPPNFIQIGCIHAVIWKWFHIADPMGLCVKKNPQHALRMETATSLNLCDQFFWKLDRTPLVALPRSCPKDFVLAKVKPYKIEFVCL